MSRPRPEMWLERLEARALRVLGALVLGIMLVFSPACQTFPGRDAGIYLYIGRLVQQGHMPYLAAWDHKPPMMYLFNALGWVLGAGSRWGVWALETACLAAAAGLSLQALRRTVGAWPAFFGAAAWIITLPLLLEGGNLTESWALLFQFAFLALFARWHQRRAWPWLSGMGACWAVTLLLRQNLIGLGVALLVLSPSLSRGKAWLRDAAAFLAGAGSVIGLVLGWLAARGAFAAFWDQAVRFNLVYSDVTLGLRVRALAEGCRILAPSGFVHLALAGWLAALIWRREARAPMVRLAVIALPIEALLTATSGRWYPHYFLAWLPAGSVLVAHFVQGWLGTERARRGWLMVLLAALAAQPAARLAHEAGRRDPLRLGAVARMQALSAPGEPVLVWGNEPGVYVLAARPCASRFFEQYALYMPGYQRPELIAQFLSDLRARPPRVVIDASAGNEIVPPLDAQRRAAWLPQHGAPLLPELEAVFRYFQTHYEPVERLGPWVVYARRAP